MAKASRCHIPCYMVLPCSHPRSLRSDNHRNRIRIIITKRRRRRTRQDPTNTPVKTPSSSPRQLQNARNNPDPPRGIDLQVKPEQIIKHADPHKLVTHLDLNLAKQTVLTVKSTHQHRIWLAGRTDLMIPFAEAAASRLDSRSPEARRVAGTCGRGNARGLRINHGREAHRTEIGSSSIRKLQSDYGANSASDLEVVGIVWWRRRVRLD
jgi:hypothetical protein